MTDTTLDPIATARQDGDELRPDEQALLEAYRAISHEKAVAALKLIRWSAGLDECAGLKSPDDYIAAREQQTDLENALTAISGVADVLHATGVDDNAAAYLSNQLTEHYHAAYKAFCRIYRLNEYRDREAAQ